MDYTATDRQALIDVALITTGCSEGVWALAELNDISVTTPIDDGATMSVDTECLCPEVSRRYKNEHVTPATDVSDEELAWLLGGRIFSDEFDMIFS